MKKKKKVGEGKEMTSGSGHRKKTMTAIKKRWWQNSGDEWNSM